MAARRFEIREAFSFVAHTVAGVVEGTFKQGPTGPDLSDEHADYLDAHAVPAGLATRADSAPARKPAPTATPAAPSDAAPVPSDTQEQEQE